ncbi:Uncharacterised protein [Bordetella pertussis]|nr:Uncharacterised protein [Bordetella pertussis]
MSSIQAEMSASTLAAGGGSARPCACRACRRSSTAETAGVSAVMCSCMARKALAVQRMLPVSNGTWVDSRRSWVMSLASARRSLACCAAPRWLSTSWIQLRASRTVASRRPIMARPMPRGSTTLWTSVAQMMPRLISSTRASAVSNTSAGSVTLGKPIMAAV